jgi:hypothetical protein
MTRLKVFDDPALMAPGFPKWVISSALATPAPFSLRGYFFQRRRQHDLFEVDGL